jgi:hypothetical protein
VGLLDDLKKQAEIVRTHDDVRRSAHAENVQVVEDAMRRTFLYLHDLLEQLKVIKPVNPVVYRLPGIADLCDLTYVDSFVTYRTKLINDKEHYDRIEVFVTWGSPDELVIERDMPAAADKVRQLLWRANARFAEAEQRGPLGASVLTRFKIPKTMRMTATLRADYTERRMVMISKNLLRVGGDDFAFPADECSEKLLEDLARLLMGQPSEFRRYRTVLESDSWLK